MPPSETRSASTHSTFRPWAELPVRPWLAMTFCLVLTAVILAGMHIGAYFHERRAIERGLPVDATVISIGLNESREGSRDEIQHVMLSYTPPGATEPMESDGDLPRLPGATVTTKDILHVKIDPSQHSYWTARTEPPSVLMVLATPLMCLLVGVISFFVAWLRRAGIGKTVMKGQRVIGRVIGVRQSPLAPMSKQIGVALGGDDRRVLHCYWPTRLGPIAAGQEVEFIALPPRVVVASLYPNRPPD